MVQKIPFTSIKASGKISSTGNANIDIEPHGTGDVLIGNFHFDADQSITNSNDKLLVWIVFNFELTFKQKNVNCSRVFL